MSGRLERRRVMVRVVAWRAQCDGHHIVRVAEVVVMAVTGGGDNINL
jgi:hypothetical protein